MNPQLNYLLTRLQQNNLPHALLLVGDISSNKSEVANNFAKTLLCTQQTICNACRHCQLIVANSHPDFYRIQPEEKGKAIKIDTIRELIEKLNQTAQQNSYKIAIIEPADALNIAASNALLKTLEEPPTNTIILLLTENPSSLSATIRSRCQILKFPATYNAFTPNTQQQKLISDFDKIANKQIDPLSVAAQWSKKDAKAVIEDLILITIEHIRHLPNMNRFKFLDKLYLAKQQLQRSNPNQQLLLENLFCNIF